MKIFYFFAGMFTALFLAGCLVYADGDAGRTRSIMYGGKEFVVYETAAGVAIAPLDCCCSN